MKSKEIPLQSEARVQKHAGTRGRFTGAGASLQRRLLLQLFGAASLGLALPFAGPGGSLAAATPAEEPAEPAAPFWQPAGTDALTAIFTRRSQREYSGEAVAEADLRRILAAGMNAPSAHNTRPWSFVVLTGRESLGRIPRLIPYTQYAVKAGAAVVPCVHFPEEEAPELAFLSVACCVQNMLLASHALGYGSVWIQIYPNPDLMQAWRKELNIPGTISPLAVMPIGRPVSPLPPVNRMDPTKIHFETWGGSQRGGS